MNYELSYAKLTERENQYHSLKVYISLKGFLDESNPGETSC